MPDRVDGVDGVYGVISELYKPLLDRSHLDEPCLLFSATGLSITFCVCLPSVYFAVCVSPPLWRDVVMQALGVNVTNTFL